jgi:hypothetical protein
MGKGASVRSVWRRRGTSRPRSSGDSKGSFESSGLVTSEGREALKVCWFAYDGQSVAVFDRVIYGRYELQKADLCISFPNVLAARRSSPSSLSHIDKTPFEKETFVPKQSASKTYSSGIVRTTLRRSQGQCSRWSNAKSISGDRTPVIVSQRFPTQEVSMSHHVQGLLACRLRISR